METPHPIEQHRPQRQSDHDAGDETTDMSFPGHAGLLNGELQKQPQRQISPRRDMHEEDNEERQHAMCREEDQVCAEYPGDSPRSTNHGNGCFRIAEDESSCGDTAGDQVEEQVAQGPVRLFDVVPEYPQEPHVRNQMTDPAVEEHRQQARQPDVLVGEGRCAGVVEAPVVDYLILGERITGCKFAGDGCVLIKKLGFLRSVAAGLPEKEHRNIQAYQGERDDWGDPGGVEVSDWEQDAFLS